MVRNHRNGFLSGLSVDADISADTDLLGKSASDLQTDISIEDGDISGTLKLVTDYTGFSGDVSLQSGNYLALHFAHPDADRISVVLNGGTDSAKDLDADGLAIFRVTDEATQTITVTAYKGGNSASRTLSLDGLTLSEE